MPGNTATKSSAKCEKTDATATKDSRPYDGRGTRAGAPATTQPEPITHSNSPQSPHPHPPAEVQKYTTSLTDDGPDVRAPQHAARLSLSHEQYAQSAYPT